MEFYGTNRIREFLNLAPLIDIVFLLLIFFLLTSSFLVDEGIEVNVPSSETSQQNFSEPDLLTVSVNSNGEVFVDGLVRSMEDLGARVKLFTETNKQAQILLKSDATVNVQTLVSVIDQLKKSGAEQITLAAKRQ